MSDEENKTVRFQMLMSPSEAKAIDDWGWERRIRTRAEAIRQLASRGMAVDDLDQAVRDQFKIIKMLISPRTPERHAEVMKAMRSANAALARARDALNTELPDIEELPIEEVYNAGLRIIDGDEETPKT